MQGKRIIVDIFTSLGLALPAGLNAYIPLLIIGLTDRFTDLITLDSPYDILSSDIGLAVLVVLLVVELFADAIPGLDHVNDIVHTFVRPASGGIIMTATDMGILSDVNPAILFLLGIIAAGSVHAAKATTRPVVTATTGGLGNPFVSTVENIIAVFVSILAILIPIILLIVLAFLMLIVTRWIFRRVFRRAAMQQS